MFGTLENLVAKGHREWEAGQDGRLGEDERAELAQPRLENAELRLRS